MNALEVQNLNKHFQGVYAVKNLSFEIKQGSITSIIGPNGAGKTTLTNALSGMLLVDSGSMVISGNKIVAVKPYQMPVYGLTRTFQNVRLFEQMSVLDNLMVVLTKRSAFFSLFEYQRQVYIARAYDILKKIGLEAKAQALAVNLSYGQRKLLEIGRTLAMDADVYLFDEPFAGLFPEMIKVIIGILKNLKQQGKTVVLIEHNMDLIRELSDYVLVLDSGRLLAQGEPDEVLNRREVIEAYLGE